MQTISATDAKQRMAAMLDAAQREPVVIRRQKRDVAVVMSMQEFERLRAANLAEFDRLCDHIGSTAEARGFTQEKMDAILNESHG